MDNIWQQLKKPILALAPMEGITDAAFRQTCRTHGADIVYTEFISSDAIGHNARRAFEKMTYAPEEQPVICQIFGCNPDMFVAAAQEIKRRGFAGIDVNLGCPARAVVKNGGGVALLRNPTYARELIARVVDAVDIPVSIKVRTKIRRERKEVAPDLQEWVTALDLLDALADIPVAAVMVHGRSFEQGHSGEVDVEMIRDVKQRFTRGPVLANGGIFTPERAVEMLEQTGADGVGIARGAQGNPWIFQQVRELLNTTAYRTPDWGARVDVMLQHAERAVHYKGRWGVLEMRKHLAWYVHGFPRAGVLRRQLVRAESLEDIQNILRTFDAEAAKNESRN